MVIDFLKVKKVWLLMGFLACYV